MSRSRCITCGLIHQPGQCDLQTSATPSDRDKTLEITPLFCCTCYLFIVASFFVLLPLILGLNKVGLGVRKTCYVELFANSVSVSNANENTNVSAADWKIGFVARSPITGCEVTMHTLNSRLLRGGDVISESSSPLTGYIVTEDKAEVYFEKVVMPRAIGDVIWDSWVEVVFAMNTNVRYLNGYLFVACPAIPVRFTKDQAGKVMGSLLGNMRRCDYTFQQKLTFNSLRS